MSEIQADSQTQPESQSNGTGENTQPVNLGGRVVSAKVAAALSKAMAEVRGPEDDAPTEETPPLMEAPGREAPAPEYPAHVVDAMVRMSDAQQRLEKREADLRATIERAQRVEGLRGKYQGNRLPTLKEALKDLSDNDVEAEMAAIYEEYTRQVLGIEPDSQTQALSKTAKLEQELRAIRQEQAEAEKRRADEAESKKAEAEVRQNVETIGQFISGNEGKFPLLSALARAGFDDEPSAGEAVWNEMVREFEKSGQTLSIDEAAKRRESFLRSRLEPFRHLLTPGTPAKAPDSQIPSPTSQKMRVLSQSVTAAPSIPSKLEPPKTNEERRARTLAKLGQILREQR